MDPKGNVLLKKNLENTKIWPNPLFTLNGYIDLEKEYKEALSGKICVVMDIGVDGSFLVLGKSSKVGDFIWVIDKEDSVGFLPIIKKNGILVPAGLSPIDEFKYMAEILSKNE